MVRIRGQ